MQLLVENGPTVFGIPNAIVVAFILGGLLILAAISAFAAQRWAQRCHDELKKINTTLETMQREQQGITPPERQSSYLDDDQ